MDDLVKIILEIKFPNNTDAVISVEKVNDRINECRFIDDKVNTIFYTKDKFAFRKANYFYLSKSTCTMPVRIVSRSYNTMYSCKMSFKSDFERKEFFEKFKNYLEEFSKSEIFIDRIPMTQKRVAFLDEFWIVY
jgi:hypothetical protein